METVPTLWEVAEMDLGIADRRAAEEECSSNFLRNEEGGKHCTEMVEQEQQQPDERTNCEFNRHQSEVKSSLDLLASRSDDISVDLLNFVARTQHDLSAEDKEYICTIASNIRAHFQKTLECSRSLFQSNVRCFLHIIELQKHHEEYQREKNTEILKMQGRIDGLMDILGEKQKENQTLREGMELKGLWGQLLQPFSESPGGILSDYDLSEPPSTYNGGNLSFSTALTWLSAACAGRVLADPNHQNTQMTDYIAQLIPEIRRCHQVACENHEETERQNENLRNLLAKKSAMYSMAQEQCANADHTIERLQMELEDAHAEVIRRSEMISRYSANISGLNESLTHTQRSRNAYRELSDRLGSRLKVSENLIKQYEYDINNEFGVSDRGNREEGEGEEETSSYQDIFDDDISTTVSGASTVNEQELVSDKTTVVSGPLDGAFDDLLIATAPLCKVNNEPEKNTPNAKTTMPSGKKKVGVGISVDGNSDRKLRDDIKERRLSFSNDNVSPSPTSPSLSPSSSAIIETSNVAELDLNTSAISISESVNNISVSSVPIRRVIKRNRVSRLDSLKHLTIPLGRDMDIWKTPSIPKSKQSLSQERRIVDYVSTPKNDILDEEYRKELESELESLKLKSPELHKEIATVLKDVLSPQTVAFDFSPTQEPSGGTNDIYHDSNDTMKGVLDIQRDKVVCTGNGKLFSTPRQVKLSTAPGASTAVTACNN